MTLTARDCFQVCGLAELFGLQYKKNGRHYGKNKILKVIGTIIRSIQLLPAALRERPAIAVSHGSRSQLIAAKNSIIENLKPGETVRIKSREDIKVILNRWNQLKGFAFMEEMWPYCGTTHRVFKRIEKYLDERDYLIKKFKNIVILEGVFCEGTKYYGPCDRSYFLFWREEWFERIDAE